MKFDRGARVRIKETEEFHLLPLPSGLIDEVGTIVEFQGNYGGYIMYKVDIGKSRFFWNVPESCLEYECKLVEEVKNINDRVR